MTIDDETILLHLGRRELISLVVGQPMSLRCLEASVWITQSGRGEDTIVHAGTSATLDHPGVAVVQALTAGMVCLSDRVAILPPPNTNGG